MLCNRPQRHLKLKSKYLMFIREKVISNIRFPHSFATVPLCFVFYCFNHHIALCACSCYHRLFITYIPELKLFTLIVYTHTQICITYVVYICCICNCMRLYVYMCMYTHTYIHLLCVTIYVHSYAVVFTVHLFT